MSRKRCSSFEMPVHCCPNRVKRGRGLAFCRDKGRSGVDVGALCLSSSGVHNPAKHHTNPTESSATRTSTRPPPIPTSTPCPYRTEARTLLHSFLENRQMGKPPPSSVVSHAATGSPIISTFCMTAAAIAPLALLGADSISTPSWMPTGKVDW